MVVLRGKRKTCKFLKVVAVSLLIILPFVIFYDLKLIMVAFFSVTLLEAYIVWKEKIGRELVIAFFLALIVTSYYNYFYTTSNILIGRINLFPLVSWTFGLLLLRELYVRINIKYEMILFILFYLALLLSLEYIFYNFFGVRLYSNYPGLFGLNLMHAPMGMKFFYIVAGPVYLLTTEYLRLK